MNTDTSTETKIVSDTWQEGYAAYYFGVTHDRCPYPNNTEERAWWSKGWRVAKHEP